MKKVVVVLLVVCLLSMAGCSKKLPTSSSTTPSTSQSTTSPKPAASIPTLAQRRATALKALSDVMLNNATFVCTDYHNQALYLKNLTARDTGNIGNIPATTAYEIASFQVLDVDGDGVPEAIVQAKLLSSTLSYQCSVILHYQDGKVYGYFYQAVTDEIALGSGSFAKNGLFGTMDSARDNSIGKIRFLGTYLDTTYLLLSEANDNRITTSLSLYDVTVSPGICDSQINKMAGDTAPSYTYSEANIAQWITNRPVSADPKPVLSNANMIARQSYLDGLAGNNLLRDPRDNDSYNDAGTLEQLDLMQGYYQAWDKELNSIYGLLEKKLPADQMEALRKDEQQWITVRDENGSTAHQKWIKAYGTGSPESADRTQNANLAITTKNRTFYLIDRYFGDTSQPTTTEIIQKYGLKQ